MGLVSKTVRVQPKSRQIRYFWDKGYEFSYGDYIDVKIEDLSPGTKIKVDCECDYCNAPMHISYYEYLRIMNGIVPKLACPDCKGKKTQESNMITYGVPSVGMLPEVKEKVKQTSMERYGKEYYAQTDESKQRHEQTFMERYGQKTSLLDSEVQKKIVQTLNDKFGVDYPWQSPEIYNKVQETIQEKYQVNNISQSEAIKQKKRDTVMANFGVEYPLQSKEIQNKIEQTNIIKYGHKNPMQNREIKSKANETLFKNNTCATSIQQLYLHALYGGELNKNVEIYNCDILLDNIIDLEYDGGGHDLCVKRGIITEEEFQRKEIIRHAVIKRNGYKTIRIISEQDKLPSDQILFQILDLSKAYFRQYPNHSWIEWIIDKGIYRNAENKDGVPFNFGELRRIKKDEVA